MILSVVVRSSVILSYDASDLQTRKKYVSLVETARDRGAKVFVFSRSVPSVSHSPSIGACRERARNNEPTVLFARHAW